MCQNLTAYAATGFDAQKIPMRCMLSIFVVRQ